MKVEDELTNVMRIVEQNPGLDKKDKELLVEPLIMLLQETVAAEGLLASQVAYPSSSSSRIPGKEDEFPRANELSPEQKRTFYEALHAGKIPLIKWYRNMMGTGLKESKDEVERVIHYINERVEPGKTVEYQWRVDEWNIVSPITGRTVCVYADQPPF